MKKKAIIALIMALTLLLPTFCTVSAKSDADKLNELGLFKGTDKGYELERVPTRGEAMVMLVRFIGKEKEALADYSSVEIPFTDVPAWAHPYVAYLYKNGITVGFSETYFGTTTACSLQMYCTLMLRALGYSDLDGDFEYADALEYALAKDLLLPMYNNPDAFTRDTMVAISTRALTLPTADYHYEMLAYKLARQGTITEDQADAIKEECVANQYRLAFIGDSITWSGCCTNQDEDSYPAWVSRWLGVNFCCRNFGQGGATYGYSTINNDYEYVHVAAYEKSKEFQPEFTIIMFGTNDSCYYSGSSVKSMIKDAKVLISTYTDMDCYKQAVICSGPWCPQQGSAVETNINPSLKKMAESLELPYIDTIASTKNSKLSYDNVHYTDNGYISLAKGIFTQYVEVLVEKGYMDRTVADAKLKYAKLEAEAAIDRERIPDEGNVDDELVAKAKETKADASNITFVCSDFDSSGPIYMVSSEIYDQLSRSGAKRDDGWIRVNESKLKIGKYQLANWAPGGYYDVKVFKKQIGDYYFVWFDNLYALADIDTKYTSGTYTFNWTKGSADIYVHFTAENALTGSHEIAYVCRDTDATGYVYTLTEEIAKAWNYIEGYDVEMGGVTWKRVDTFGMYFNIAYYDWGHYDGSQGYNRDKNVNQLEWLYGTEYYVAEVNGIYYFWERYADNYGKDFNSDRVTLNWPCETENGTVMRASTFYRYTGVIRNRYEVPTDAFKLLK